ncbi:hypothetical protein MKW94_004977 [Papaver nudicaule]|uniref:RING-type domain-containing protein n=1 Tax=Papaver nudicaule TaxID=74823 RepID=A0AA41UUW6_PAPNU|nr:hypothetical protein [Papaver nudicaule]
MDSIASTNGANSRNCSLTRRSEGYGSRCRSLFYIGTWILVEIFVILSLFASIVVLSSSRHEKPKALLLVWVIGYASGCVATFPLLYCRFLHRNQGNEQDLTQTRQDVSQTNPPSEPSPFVAVSVLQSTDEEDRQTAASSARSAQSVRASARVKLQVERFNIALQLFFSVWTVFGNFWVFRVQTFSAFSAEGSTLYSFCILFLRICCLGYGLIDLAHAIIRCCLPRPHEILKHTRGAATETIIGLPTYKFKLKDGDGDINSEGVGESAGTLEAGTKKEFIFSGEDAECSICLANYADNEELRELPCAHFFHVECVDKWLKENVSCPLCNCDI